MPEQTDDLENIIFADVSEVQSSNSSSVSEAAQVIASQMGRPPVNTPINTTTSPNQAVQNIQTVAPPPSQPIETEEDRVMNRYNEEKKKLFEIHDQLLNLAHQDKSGSIIRNFDLSQIVLQVGDQIDRVNGFIVLRSLKSICKTVSMTKEEEKTSKTVQDREECVSSVYEVWGIMEDGGVGLTSSYSPEMVMCVLSLKSGYDLPPED